MPYYQSFLSLTLFLGGGVAFLLLGRALNRLLSRRQPNDEKTARYECGEAGQGGLPDVFNVRYYVVGLAFLLFEVEIIFLVPWALSLAEPGGRAWRLFSLVEMSFFIGAVGLGWFFLWRKGYLQWGGGVTKRKAYPSPVPASLYAQVNERYLSAAPPS